MVRALFAVVLALSALLFSRVAWAFDLDGQPALSQGRWLHEVPLELPPAPRGTVPSLAFVADHGVGDGPLGQGWRITGFSRIERRGATGGAAAFDSTDTFWVDGMRLYWTTGPSQAGYRQEVDDNRVFYRFTGENQNFWTAQRDGWTWTFGEFEDGVATVGACATETPGESYPCDDHLGEALNESGSVAWLLSRVEAPAGNVIEFDYTGRAGFDTYAPDAFIVGARAVHLPARITYGGGNVEVAFEWEARTDTSFAVRGGAPWVLAARLVRVVVEAGVGGARQSVGGYAFHWLDEDLPGTSGSGVACDGETLPDEADVWGSVLHRIGRLGADLDLDTERQLRCMEVDVTPTTFSAPIDESLPSSGSDPESYVTMAQDFDGDGVAELGTIRFGDDGYGGWAIDACDVPVLCELDWIDVQEGAYGMVDLDGDGVQEAFTVQDADPADPALPYARDLRTVEIHDGALRDQTTRYDGDDPSSNRLIEPELLREATFVDIDGDGLADLVTETAWVRNLGEAPWFLDVDYRELPADWYSGLVDAFVDAYNAELAAVLPVPLSSSLTRKIVQWGDFNEDGIADVVAFVQYADLDGLYENSYPGSSRVWYGDGLGGFRTSTLCESDTACAGQYYESDNSTPWNPPDLSGFAAVDLDRDGRAEYVVGSGTEAYSEGGLTGGWTVGGTTLPIEAIRDEYHCAEALSTRKSALFYDADADGFTDVVQVDGRTLHTWLNERQDTRGRILRMHGPWGGVTELSYASTVAVGENEHLPFPMEVVRSVSDETGTTQLTFGGGTFEDGRFRGFTDVQVAMESGRTASLKYAVSPGFEGALVYRAEHRQDGTLAQVSYHHYLLDRGHAWIFDDEPPYFNPEVRTCRFDVGPGYLSGLDVAQTVTVENLAQLCAESLIPTDFAGLMFSIVYGWDRNPGDGQGLRNLADRVWEPDGVQNGDFADIWSPSPTMWNPPTPSRDSGYADLDGPAPAEVAIPSTPADSGPGIGNNPTDLRMWLTRRVFDADQRIELVDDRRDHSTTSDDLRTAWGYGAWDTSYVGKQTTTVTVNDPAGTTRSTSYGGFVGFDLPGTVTESGFNSAGGASRTSYYTYDRGVVSGLTHPGGAVESWDVGDCGLYTEHVDEVGRVETTTWDAACQETSRTFEGSVVSTERDTFGRITRRTVTPLVGGLSADVVEERLYDDVLDDADDRDDWGEPRAAIRLTSGTDATTDDVIELQYLDPWGRPGLTVRCANGGADGSATTSSVLAEVSCDPNEAEVRVWRGWATDGSPRAVSRGFGPGETDVAATWTYSGEFGAIERRLDPAPDVVSAQWVTTRYLRTPSTYTVTDPMETTCTTTRGGVSWSRSCEGIPRGGRTFDAWGQVISEEDGEGDGFTYTYDGLGRQTVQELNGTITLSSGTGRPRWERTWDARDRLGSVEDAAGNIVSWTYDDVGRPLTETFVPGVLGGGSAVRGQWTWHDYAGSSTSRRVSVTDENGFSRTAWLDGLGRTWKAQDPDGDEAQVWDARGRPSARVDVDGIITELEFDDPGRLIEVTVGGTEVTTFEVNAAGDRTAVEDPYGVLTWLDYTWDGRLSSATRPYSGGVWSLQALVYQDDGRVATAWRGGFDTEYAYDPIGRLEAACFGGDCTDWLARETWSWDDADRMVGWSRESADVMDGPSASTWAYNGAGWVTSATDAGGGVTRYGWDVLGNLRTLTDADNLVSAWTYDGWGRMVREDLPHQDPRTWSTTLATSHGELRTRTESDGGIWRTWTDHRGRVTREERPDGTGLNRYYVGTQLRGVDHLDAFGGTLAFEAYGYDGLGRPSWSWGPADGPYDPSATPGAGDWWFEYLYDDGTPGDGELTVTRIAPDGEETSRTVSDGVVTSETISDGVGAPRLMRTYGYDSAFPTLEEEALDDAAGSATRLTEYEYERGYRLVGTYTRVGTGPMQSRIFGMFDAWGVPREAESTLGGTLESSYDVTTDATGRVTGYTATHDGVTLGAVEYTYTTAGRVLSVDTAWAGGFAYVRSATTGLVTDVTSIGGASTLASVTSRDALGRADVVSLAGGGTIESTWDQNGRIDHWVSTSAAGLDERTWRYDDRGRAWRVDHVDGTGSWSEEREYAEPGWLLSEKRMTGAGVVTREQSYVYDAGGNRIEAWDGTTLSHTYAYDGSFLAAVDGSAVTWALDGISVDHKGTTISRDPDGGESMVSVALGPSYAFARDPWGRPVLTDDGAGVREQAWGNPGGVWPLAGVDENGDVTVNVALEGVLVGVLTNGVFAAAATDPGGNLAFLGSDAVGAPYAFGEGTTGPSSSTFRHVFGGLEQLPGTDYHLARHRLYDAGSGRFDSADPAGLDGGPHRFTYAGNDPTSLWDPSGMVAGGCGIEDLGAPLDRIAAVTYKNPSGGTDMVLSRWIVDGEAGQKARDAEAAAAEAQALAAQAAAAEAAAAKAEADALLAAALAVAADATATQMETEAQAIEPGVPVASTSVTVLDVKEPMYVQGDAAARGAEAQKLREQANAAKAEAATQRAKADSLNEAAKGLRKESKRLEVAADALSAVAKEKSKGLKNSIEAAQANVTYVVHNPDEALGDLGERAGDTIANSPLGLAAQGDLSGATNALYSFWSDRGKSALDKGLRAQNYGGNLGEAVADIFSGDPTTAKNGINNAIDETLNVVEVAGAIASMGGGGAAAANPCNIPNSFAAGTPVVTSRGVVPIEEVRRGDYVWAEDPETGEHGFRRVLDTTAHVAPVVLEVRWRGFGVPAIWTTPHHPFYVDGEGWVRAGDLTPGDLVVTSVGGWAQVESVSPAEPEVVFNLLVEGLHTYFVGEQGVWVHNGCAGKVLRGVKGGADEVVEAGAGASRGTIYKVPGEATPSGKPYIGRHKGPDPAKTRRSSDGRDRTKAEVVGEYDPTDVAAGRRAEQASMNSEGGLGNLDNKRNEITPAKWEDNGIEPPKTE